MSDDISDDQDATTTTIMIDEVNLEIEEQKQAITFRNCAFYVTGIIIVLFFCAVLFWLLLFPLCFLDLHQFAGGIKNPEAYTKFLSETKSFWILGIVVLSAIPTTLTLALLRFTFRKSKEKDKDDDVPGVWMSLIKEIVDVAKDYIKNRAK